MRRPGGYMTVTEPDKATIERDTFTCGHCNGIVIVLPNQPPEDMGGQCKLCMSLTCAHCTGLGRCDPFEKKLERMEAKDRLYRAARGERP
jgi:hypothetical protein